MFVHADIETLLKITHWRSSVCHTSGAFSNAAWLVLHCVTTQNGGTAASGGWLQTALHWPCDCLQQRWPAKLVSLACRATWSVLISSIRLLRSQNTQLKIIHTGPTSSAVVTHLQPPQRWVCGGTHTDADPELSLPVVSGKNPEAESLLGPPLTAVKC